MHQPRPQFFEQAFGSRILYLGGCDRVAERMFERPIDQGLHSFGHVAFVLIGRGNAVTDFRRSCRIWVALEAQHARAGLFLSDNDQPIRKPGVLGDIRRPHFLNLHLNCPLDTLCEESADDAQPELILQRGKVRETKFKLRQ